MRQWIDHVKQSLSDIEKEYPHSSLQQRAHLRERFQRITEACDEVLEAWAQLEEQVAHLLERFPDLVMEEEGMGEAFWLAEHVVRAFRQGQGYYDLTMFAEAKPYFEQVVEEEPEFLLGRLYLALSDFQQKRWDEAHRQFRLVAETADHPYFTAFAHHMMGCVHVLQQEDRKAIRQFEQSLSRMGENPDAWFNLGACHYRLGEYHEAVPFFYRALLLDEDDWESMYYLSCCFEKTRQWESVSYWRMAVFEKTNSPSVMECIAQDFEETGDPEQALHWYRKLVQRDPKRISGYYGVGWNLWMVDRREEAFLWLKKGLTLNPRDPDLLFTYVWFLLQEGRWSEVEYALRQLPGELNRHPLWLVIRSRLFAHHGDDRRAAQAAEQVIRQEQGPVRSLGHYQMGRILLDQHRVREALDHFRQAQQCCPQWKEPLFYEGLCHFLSGRPDITRRCWEQIVWS